MPRAQKEVSVPSGRHGLPPETVAVFQRERLFSATVEVVASKGYRNVSVDEIVKEARVGYVAFYDLFENKEACFYAAFDRIVEEAAAAISAAAADIGEWSEQIAAGLSCAFDLIAADPLRARFALVEVLAVGRSGDLHYERAIGRAVPKLREGRRRSKDAAHLSDTLEEAILGGIAWIVHQRLVKGELQGMNTALSETIQIALAPYLGEKEARRRAETALRKRSREG